MTRWLVLLAGLTIAGCGGPQQDDLMVSAAASLQNAMRELAASAKVRVVFNFGASGMLAQQIQQGAPADIFLSASPKPMDALAAAGLIVEDTRRNLLRNRIVLIAPRDRGLRGFS